MNNVVLRWFQLDPSWSTLLERLESWKRLEQSIWTDGISVVKLASESQREPRFGFQVSGKATWSTLKSQLVADGFDERDGGLVVKGPSGISVRFDLVEGVGDHPERPPELVMNHISLNVKDLNLERAWYERVLGSSVVLARDEVWEPICRTFVRDVHLFRSPAYYVTLREREISSVDHVGWMASSVEKVNQLAEIVKSLRWDIVFGPAEIDGCFLFHFMGPDGRIHDFFSPLDELLRRGSAKE